MSREPQRYALARIWLIVGLIGCAIVFYACLMPHPGKPPFAHFDKLEHASAFAVLGAWFAGVLARRRHLWVFIGLAAFGGFIELAQSLTSYGDTEWGDWLADSVGVLAGIGLARLGVMNWLRYIDTRVAAKRNHPG